MTYWNEKVALVTGASRGLGLAIARRLVRQGATVILTARDPADLAAAAESLKGLSGAAIPMAADVTSDDDVKRLEKEIESRFGRLDLLVNNVGISSRGKLLETQLADFRRQWELNVMTAIRCVQAFAPMITKRKGHIVNIGSLASKSAARFIGPYATTKFALAGFTQQLRLELADQGVHVLLVCPGPIAREDAGARYDDQASELPAETRQPGAGVKLKAIDPAQLATAILQGCERRQAELVMPWKARVLFAVAQVSPRWGDWLQAKFSSRRSRT